MEGWMPLKDKESTESVLNQHSAAHMHIETVLVAGITLYWGFKGPECGVCHWISMGPDTFMASLNRMNHYIQAKPFPVITWAHDYSFKTCWCWHTHTHCTKCTHCSWCVCGRACPGCVCGVCDGGSGQSTTSHSPRRWTDVLTQGRSEGNWRWHVIKTNFFFYQLRSEMRKMTFHKMKKSEGHTFFFAFSRFKHLLYLKSNKETPLKASRDSSKHHRVKGDALQQQKTWPSAL